MTKKLKLSLDEIVVESFETSSELRGRGTVHGASAESDSMNCFGTCGPTQVACQNPPPTDPAICPTGEGTCAQTCGGLGTGGNWWTGAVGCDTTPAAGCATATFDVGCLNFPK
jgi:hypothetical protein